MCQKKKEKYTQVNSKPKFVFLLSRAWYSNLLLRKHLESCSTTNAGADGVVPGQILYSAFALLPSNLETFFTNNFVNLNIVTKEKKK